MTEPAAASSSVIQESKSNAAPLIVAGGVATTAIALFFVWLANQYGENVMGLYADYVLPVGALLVGLVASSGYGIASYATGTKVTGRLLATVLLLLVASYFVAKYAEFRLLFPQGAVREDGTAVGFWEYYDVTTRAIYWKAEHSGDTDGNPLGMWGYLLRLGEIVGFAGGGLITPFALRSLPYCASCQRYKKTKRLAFFAAGVEQKKVKKPDEVQAFVAADAAARASAEATLGAIFGAAAKGEAPALAAELRKPPQLGNYGAQKLTARIAVSLVHCPRCHEGALKAALQTGRGKQIRTKPLAEQAMERGAVEDFVRFQKGAK